MNKAVISDALRQAISESRRTHYSLAKEAGIRPQMTDYFMRGEKSLTLVTVDKLAGVLGVQLTARQRHSRHAGQ